MSLLGDIVLSALYIAGKGALESFRRGFRTRYHAKSSIVGFTIAVVLYCREVVCREIKWWVSSVEDGANVPMRYCSHAIGKCLSAGSHYCGSDVRFVLSRMIHDRDPFQRAV